MIKLEGRILLFDTINFNNDIFPSTCVIDIPEKIPLTWNFNIKEVIGIAEVKKDSKGLVVKAEIIPNIHCSEDDIHKIFEYGKFGAGGYYNKIKMHNEGSLIIVDKAALKCVSLVLAPVRDEYYLEIVKEE